uniref:Ig-like domain-containing protein n=1 Tax=Gadus morhua TaxID=8049 RepID=A0A8C5FMY6_GADMO
MFLCNLTLSLCCVFVCAQAPDPHVFIYKRVGDSVTLQCNNVLKEYTQCSSVTWNYGRNRSRIVELGRWRQGNLSGSSRLSLQPGCFLNISDINVGDAGRYICRQYDSLGIRHGVDEITVLSVLSGITQEDVLTCSVYSYDGACRGVSLRWSDQGTNGVEKTSVDFASKDQKTHSQTNITSGAPGGKGPGGPKVTMTHWFCELGQSVCVWREIVNIYCILCGGSSQVVERVGWYPEGCCWFDPRLHQAEYRGVFDEAPNPDLCRDVMSNPDRSAPRP